MKYFCSILFALLFLTYDIANAQNEFITIWKTDNPGSTGGTQIRIPAQGSYSIYWENTGNPTSNGTLTGISNAYTLTLPVADTYLVKIIGGSFNRFNFSTGNGGDRLKLLSITQWGTTAWVGMDFAYDGCQNLSITATDTPNTAGVTDFVAAFRGCKSLTTVPGMGGWNVSNVIRMNEMFSDANKFNQDISGWNVSNVTTMASMFLGAAAFNQPIGNWQTGNVITMAHMFRGTTSFNQSLNGWNVSSVTDMYAMFNNAPVFNQLVGNWQTGNVKNMGFMFSGASAFNQPINSWNVSRVKDMSSMFQDALVFNQPIGNWQVDSVASMQNMFYRALQFNQPIGSWNVSNVLSTRSMFALTQNFNQPLAGWQLLKDTTTAEMFSGTMAFDQPIGNWYVNRVKEMASMFAGAAKFNQPIQNWQTDSVRNMSGMFSGTLLFNQPLGNWNTSRVTNMASMFARAAVFNSSIAGWNVQNVQNMSRMFMEAKKFDQPINSWNVNRVKDMNFMFYYAFDFNQPLNDWAVDSVTDMSTMFYTAQKFNQPINDWNVGRVTNMSNMFMYNEVFDQPLDNWDVRRVKNMTGMFYYARAFNQALASWKVDSVTNMSNMFQLAVKFNQPLGSWNVSRVTNMSAMFDGAQVFNQDLGSWNLASVTNMATMFNGFAGYAMDCNHYSRTLMGWAANPNMPANIMLGAGNRQYSPAAVTARNYLTGTKGWTIQADALSPSCSQFTPEQFITTWKSDNTGSSNSNQIAIPATGTNYRIYWENSSNPAVNGTVIATGPYTLTLPSADTYRVAISNGTFNRITFNNTGDRLKLLKIEQWGLTSWASMENAYYGCENLAITAIDLPVISQVANMAHAFEGCLSITNITGLVNWDVSQVTNMSGLFRSATSFNQPLEDWNVGLVTDMSNMFRDATAFNQPLGFWNLASIANMANMLDGTNINCANYSLSLVGWAGNINIPSGITLGASGGTYGANAVASRNNLVNSKGWNITDAGSGNCTFIDYDQYVTIWKTDNFGISNNNAIRIPATGNNYNIFWESTADPLVNGTATGSGNYTLTFPATGTYRVAISPGSGSFSGITFGSATSDSRKLLRITRWGNIAWTTMAHAYDFCTNLTVTATDVPNTQQVTSMAAMFRNCGALTTIPNIGNWNTSNVTDMSYMFAFSKFNSPIDSWNVSQVTDMSYLFSSDVQFNQPVGSWNVGNVTNMKQMFYYARVFSHPVSNWNVSKVTDMSEMFVNVNNYNHPMADWDVRRVKDMSSMFRATTIFNQPLNTWQVDSVTNMAGMFFGAQLFNQPLHSWNVSRVTGMSDMFRLSGFNQPLSTWNVSSVTSMEGMFDNAYNFNQPINTWNVSQVKNMARMFTSSRFNQSLGNWNVGNVTDMRGMFNNAFLFNQEMDSWDVSKVRQMDSMFMATPFFNKPLNNWNTDSVRSMNSMFRNAVVFNQPLNSWATGKVTGMNAMFMGAAVFNQDLSAWDFSHVLNMDNMFMNASGFDQTLGNWNPGALSMVNMLTGSGISCRNYTFTLRGWANNSSLPNGVSFSAAGKRYGNMALLSRNTLISVKGWSVTDGGYDATCTLITPQDYVTIWKTDNTGSSNNNQVTIPATGTQYSLYWEEVGNEGNSDTATGNGNYTLTFSAPGTYRVAIKAGSGTFNAITFNNTGDKSKLTGITQWGNTAWSDMTGAYYGCHNLTVTATDIPDLANAHSLAYTFAGCSNLNNVPNIENWVTTGVSHMEHLFDGAALFNRPIGSWNVSAVTDMGGMFRQAAAFNQPLNSWQVTNVNNMAGMFSGAAAFNRSLDSWNVSAVTNMDSVFFNAAAFDQPLHTWNITSVQSMKNMLNATAINCRNYSKTLISWAANPNLQNGVVLGAAGRSYAPSVSSAKNILITQKGWTISDNGADTSCSLITPQQYLSIWKTDNPGSSNANQVTIPATGSGYDIYWQEAGNENNNGIATGSGTHTITFPSAGTYLLAISAGNGTFSRISFANAGDKSKLLELKQWGTTAWSSMAYAYYGCNNLQVTATDLPVLSSVTSMSYMFAGCSSLTTVPGITNWSLATVNDMNHAFYQALLFDQNIGRWNVAGVTNLSSVFSGAASFNQFLGDWNLNAAVALNNMLDNSGMDCTNYSATLINWAARSLPTGRIFGASGINYGPAGSSARDTLIIRRGWTITDGSLNPGCSAIRPEQYVTVWKSNNPGSIANRIIIPATGTGYQVYWENTGNPAVNRLITATEATTLIFPVADTYRVAIRPGAGSFNRIRFAGTGDRQKLLQIEQWGDIVWSDMASAYSSCNNLTITATDIPDLSIDTSMSFAFSFCTALTTVPNMQNWDVSKVTSMTSMFQGATKFNQSLEYWNVANVKNMRSMFSSARAFNQPLNSWNVGLVTDMSAMFSNADVFNQSIGDWDVSQVTNINSMFNYAVAFNQPIGNWNVGRVTNMSYMFNMAEAFNQPIGNWDVKSVSDMTYMFYNAEAFDQQINNWDVGNVLVMYDMFDGAKNFNQPLHNWDVSSVTDMYSMFNLATKFNQDISEWDISNVEWLDNMFYGADSFNQELGSWDLSSCLSAGDMFTESGIDCPNYSNTLMGWAANPATPGNIWLGGAGTYYNPAAGVAHNVLTGKNWIMNDAPSFTLTKNVQPVSCFGAANGSASVNATGGTGNYTYSWNTSPIQTTDTVSGLAPGIYNVTVADGSGCDITETVEITQPVALIAAGISAINVSCLGAGDGSATAIPTGGTAPYTYSWNTNPIQTTAAVSGLTPGSYVLTVTDSAGCSTIDSIEITQPAAALSVTISQEINVLCFGNATGSAVALPIGGTAPYSFSWNTTPVQTDDTAINLPAGNYTVTITDNNGCTQQAEATIEQPASALAASITSETDVLCFGNATGLAVAVPTGGTAPYSFSWNTTPVQTDDTAVDLPAGNYTVTITDNNGCTQQAEATIEQPASGLTASITSETDVLCFGNATGLAVAVPTGGTAPYSFSWNTTPVQTDDTAINLPAGNYTVTITDNNGCTQQAEATIEQPASGLTASINSETDVLCFGNTIGSAVALPIGGTAPYNFSWNTTPVQTDDTAINLPAGNYTVTITDNNGCTQQAEATIEQPASGLAASITSETDVLCFGNATGLAVAVPTGGTAPYSFSWNTTPVQTDDTAINLPVGNYMVTITDNNGCTQQAEATIEQPASGLAASITSETDVLCFGNATGSAVALPIGGTAPYSFSWNTTPVQTDDTAINLPAGNYMVTITDNNGCTQQAEATIEQPASGLAASITFETDVLCFGGATGLAVAVPTGGTAPYNFSWNITQVQTNDTVINLPAGNYTVTITDNNGCTNQAEATIEQPASGLAASITSETDVLCFGNTTGSAVALPIGGTAPYNFSWNTTPVQTDDTAINLPVGNYTVTITDNNGCTQPAEATIEQPASGLTASITSEMDVLCFGNATGLAVAVPTGGTAPYNFSWNTTPVQINDTAINLQAGNYTVTITDNNGCTQQAEATIEQPASGLAASITFETDVLCFGNATGSAVALPIGGTAPYSFSWNTTPVQINDTAINLPAGNYMVTITDNNGCTQQAEATIAQPASGLAASMTFETDVLCFGGATGLAVAVPTGGTAPYHFSWNTTQVQTNDTVINLPAGNYTVTITDNNGCTNQAEATIEQPASGLAASITSETDVLCFGGATGLAVGLPLGGTAPYSFSWNTSPIQTDDTAVNLAAGLYTVTVTDNNGCIQQAETTIGQPASALAASITSKTDVLCFGAATGSAITAPTGGTAPYTYSWNTTPVQTDDTAINLHAGNYTVTITDNNGCITGNNTTITQNPAITHAVAATINSAQTYNQWPSPLNITGIYTHVFTSALGCDSTVTLNLTVIPVFRIAGKVYNDVNGLSGTPVNTIDGAGTNATSLIAMLINTLADTVVKVQPVLSNGTFLMEEIFSNNYRLMITSASVNGNVAPPASLPQGWIHTGEFLGTGAGNDNNNNGILNLGMVTADISSAKFGIEQPPVAANSTVPAQMNPGSNATVSLPNGNFNMSDPAPGAVTRIFFPAFPQGADKISIGNATYTQANWPVSGVEATTLYLFGSLLSPNISIDPSAGQQTVLISYRAVDAAGAKSGIATITMPFLGMEIGGIVHNNTDGLNGVPLNTITGPGTNAGGLYAILINDIANTVAASVPVIAGTGAYTFTGIEQGYYSVMLSTAQVQPGSALPAVTIPSGWKATGEKNGTGAGTDGYADSKIYLGLQGVSNYNIHFGIQQPPTASPATAAAQVNPGGNNTAEVPAATFVTNDPLPGAVKALYFNGALPTGANKLVLNNTTYSATNPLPPAGVYVNVVNGLPVNPILVDPVNGNIAVEISYKAVDAAGTMSAATIATMPFTKNASTANSNENNTPGNNGLLPGTTDNGGSEKTGPGLYDIHIYPNPAAEKVYVKIRDFKMIREIRLLDIQGRALAVRKDNFAEGIDMVNRSSGTYIVKVIFLNGTMRNFKVVKK